jgi:hypothetical protein
MDCSVTALLVALRLAVSLIDVGWSDGFGFTTSECNKCKCPQSQADLMECEAETAAAAAALQRDRERGFAHLRGVVAACD